MMRNLLGDRFGLILETTTKQLDSYTLIVGKDAVKFEATDTASDASFPEATLRNAGSARRSLSENILYRLESSAITTPFRLNSVTRS
jgi:uncharacterized protein (TIGR03435 family)